MKKIIPITDLQRQPSQIVGGLDESGEPVIIAQRGRAAAVLISARRYEQIEEDLSRLDELELREMVARGTEDVRAGRALSQREVRARLEKKYAARAPLPGEGRA
jgi:prevent-host-death family protein